MRQGWKWGYRAGRGAGSRVGSWGTRMGVGQGRGRNMAGPRVVPMGYRQKFGIWSPRVTVVPMVRLSWETTGSSLTDIGRLWSLLLWDTTDPQARLLWVTAGPRIAAMGYNPPRNGCGGMQTDPGMVTVGYSQPSVSHQPKHTGRFLSPRALGRGCVYSPGALAVPSAQPGQPCPVGKEEEVGRAEHRADPHMPPEGTEHAQAHLREDT